MKTIVLWGFLGSGKTTLINHLLRSYLKDKKVVVLENESGKESVDGTWLRNQKAQVVDMKAGCICCSLRNDLPIAIARIKSEIHPDVLLIEPSGLASLEELLKIPQLHVDAIITLLDVTMYPFLMKINPNYYKRQFAISPNIVLTKTEIVSEEEINDVCNELNIMTPASRIYNDYKSLDEDYWDKMINQKVTSFRTFIPIQNTVEIPSFQLKTYAIDTRVCLSDLDSLLEHEAKNTDDLVRVKGFLKEVSGRYLKVDYVCGKYKLELQPIGFEVKDTSLTFWWSGNDYQPDALLEALNDHAHLYLCRMKDLDVSDKEIYSFMGYGDARPNTDIADFIARMKAEAMIICKPKFGVCMVEGHRIDKNTIELENVFFSPSPIISHALKKSERFYILLATVGAELDGWIHQKRDGGDVMEAFIADALGSTIVEAVVAYALPFLEKKLKASNVKISNSYSPGYCGWDVSEQQKLFSLLPKGFCDITLTESSLMLPIKSVSSVIGIGSAITREEYGCAICQKKDCYKRRLIK